MRRTTTRLHGLITQGGPPTEATVSDLSLQAAGQVLNGLQAIAFKISPFRFSILWVQPLRM